MKKYFVFFLVLIIAVPVSLFAESVYISFDWKGQTAPAYILYCVDDTQGEWTVADADGILIDLDRSAEHTVYVRTSFDSVIWSRTVSLAVPAELIAQQEAPKAAADVSASETRQSTKQKTKGKTGGRFNLDLISYTWQDGNSIASAADIKNVLTFGLDFGGDLFFGGKWFGAGINVGASYNVSSLLSQLQAPSGIESHEAAVKATAEIVFDLGAVDFVAGGGVRASAVIPPAGIFIFDVNPIVEAGLRFETGRNFAIGIKAAYELPKIGTYQFI